MSGWRIGETEPGKRTSTMAPWARRLVAVGVAVPLLAASVISGCASETPAERACARFEEAFDAVREMKMTPGDFETVIQESVWPEARKADESAIVAAGRDLYDWSGLINTEAINGAPAALLGFTSACNGLD